MPAYNWVAFCLFTTSIAWLRLGALRAFKMAETRMLPVPSQRPSLQVGGKEMPTVRCGLKSSSK